MLSVSTSIPLQAKEATLTSPWVILPSMELVPLFINEGDKIQIDTRTGEYLGRSKA